MRATTEPCASVDALITFLFAIVRHWRRAPEHKRWAQSHRMRKIQIVMLVGALFACGGCGWHRDTQTLNALISAGEPFHTPFDSEPKLREAYLEGYREGYRLGLGGAYIIGGHDPDARSRGRLAGNVAGHRVYSDEEMRRIEQMVKRDQTGGTSR